MQRVRCRHVAEKHAAPPSNVEIPGVLPVPGGHEADTQTTYDYSKFRLDNGLRREIMRHKTRSIRWQTVTLFGAHKSNPLACFAGLATATASSTSTTVTCYSTARRWGIPITSAKYVCVYVCVCGMCVLLHFQTTVTADHAAPCPARMHHDERSCGSDAVRPVRQPIRR